MELEEKIAPNSLLTRRDQLGLYAQEKGVTTATVQAFLAQRQSGVCVCDPQWVTFQWRGPEKRPSHRLVHDLGCPRRKRWMQTERLFA